MSTEIPSPASESAAPAPVSSASAPAAPASAAASPSPALPVSPMAKRAGQFALIGLLINIVANGITRGLDGMVLSASGSTQITLGLAELAVVVISRLALIVVIVFGLRYAIKALPETAPG